MKNYQFYIPALDDIKKARQILSKVITKTPLLFNQYLSEKFDANIYLKREDLQVVRSYKIRGAYNKIHSLNIEGRKKGIICASAGNHAQGVAYSCKKLKLKCVIFMPDSTPKQKIQQVKKFGGDYVEINLKGYTYDDAYNEAIDYAYANNLEFVHPFDDPKVIEGQGTLGYEILEDSDFEINYLFIPVGGGGLAAGISTVFKNLSSKTNIIGVEPAGAASMSKSILYKKVISLDRIDPFIDGAAVKKVGNYTFEICRKFLDGMITVEASETCATILQLYNEAIVAEPAGAISVTGLNYYINEIKGKNIVCLLTGGNIDIKRLEEIIARSMLHKGLRHYFIIRSSQQNGTLKKIINHVLDSINGISYLEHKNATAVVGINLRSRDDLSKTIKKMETNGIEYEYLNDKPNVSQYINSLNE